MVFGLFSNKEKNLKRTIDRATNKLSQQADRWGALEALKKDGSDEAMAGLCKRWSITSSKAIEDEQEKAWVVDVLVANGTGSLGPLLAYMKSAETLSYALRAVEQIGDHDKILEIADALFASEQPGYVRMPDRRIDILRWFGEWKGATDDERIARLTPYVTDFDENSRFAAIDGMASATPDKIIEPLVTALIRPDEESGRIKRHIVEILAKAKAPLGDQAAAVTAVLTGPLSAYRVDGGVIKQR